MNLPICGKCERPILNQRNARHFGSFMAHPENECLAILKAEAERNAGDAERYRWLRSSWAGHLLCSLFEHEETRDTLGKRMADLDAAIDAAIAQGK